MAPHWNWRRPLCVGLAGALLALAACAGSPADYNFADVVTPDAELIAQVATSAPRTPLPAKPAKPYTKAFPDIETGSVAIYGEAGAKLKPIKLEDSSDDRPACVLVATPDGSAKQYLFVVTIAQKGCGRKNEVPTTYQVADNHKSIQINWIRVEQITDVNDVSDIQRAQNSALGAQFPILAHAKCWLSTWNHEYFFKDSDSCNGFKPGQPWPTSTAFDERPVKLRFEATRGDGGVWRLAA